MKLYIKLTEAMAARLLTIARHERRYPRQQAEVLLERALQAAAQHHQAEADDNDSTTEVRHASALLA